MSTLQAKSFTDLVQQIVAAIQGAAAQMLDLSVGSVLRSIVEAVSGVILWLQAMILQVQTMTRARTSVGPDKDSWYADFDFPRLQPDFATGPLNFARFTPTQQAIVPVGSTVQTTDGTQSYIVTLDTSNTSYNPALNAYVINIGATNVTVPAQAQTAGAAGNVLAGSITTITQAIPGIDTVTNPDDFQNGRDAELDPAYDARFVLYIAGLSKGTKDAIESVIANLQQNLQVKITEDEQYDGTYDPGYFYVVVDDGSGAPSSELLATVYGAIDTVRALTVRFGVFPPVVVTADVSSIITSAPGYTHAVVVGNVGIAIRSFIDALTLGADLPYTQIASVAYGVEGVQNVTAVLLNSATADLSVTDQQVIKAGTVTVA